MDHRTHISMNFNNKLLKFYDPEENMEFFNRLFNVLGILNNLSMIAKLQTDDYYVSDKYINYNKKYVELLRIMYNYDFYRWEEDRCPCSFASVHEVEILYYTEDYFQNLRKEWELSIESERMEDRNWRLLKQVEELMDTE